MAELKNKPDEMNRKLGKLASHHGLLAPHETLPSPMSVFSPESELRETVSDEEKSTKNKSTENKVQDSTEKIFFKDACRVYEIDDKIDPKIGRKHQYTENSTLQPKTNTHTWKLAFEGIVTVTEKEICFTKYSFSTDSESKYITSPFQADRIIKIHDILRLRESNLQDRKVNLKVSKVSLEKNQNQEQFALKNNDNAKWYYIFFRDSFWRTQFCEKVSKLYVLDGKMQNYHEARELMKIEMKEEAERRRLANTEVLVDVDVDSDLGCGDGVNQAQLLARHELIDLRESVESVESVETSKSIETSKSTQTSKSVGTSKSESASIEPASIEPAIFEPDLSTTPIFMPARRMSKLSTPQKRKNLEPENNEKNQKPKLDLEIHQSNLDGSNIEISIPNVEIYTDPKSPEIDATDHHIKDTNISLPSLPPNFDESLETNLPSSPCVIPTEETETTESPKIKTNLPEKSLNSSTKRPNRKKHAARSPIAPKANIKKLFSQRSQGKFSELDLLDYLKNSGLTEIRINEAFDLLSKLPNIPREPVIWSLLKKLNDRGQIIMEMPKRRSKKCNNTILLLE
jgi:hypothetical protein